MNKNYDEMIKEKSGCKQMKESGKKTKIRWTKDLLCASVCGCRPYFMLICLSPRLFFDVFWVRSKVNA